MSSKKYQNLLVIVISVISSILGSKVIDMYGWIPGLLTAAAIGAVLGLGGKYLFKKFFVEQINKKELYSSLLKSIFLFC